MSDERSLGIIKQSLKFAEDGIDNAEIALVTGDYSVAWDLISDAEQALASAKRITAILRDEEMSGAYQTPTCVVFSVPGTLTTHEPLAPDGAQ